jgi:hypothetical protein
MDTKKIRGQSQTVKSDFPAVEDPGGSLNHPFRFAGNLIAASLISPKFLPVFWVIFP